MRPSEEPSRVRTIGLLGIDLFPRSLLDELVVHLSRHVAVPCRIHRDLPELETPRLEDRPDQVDADVLLRRLESEPIDEGEVLVAVMSHDLAIPIFTFVFGRARHRGRVAIVSLHRLSTEYYGQAADSDLLHRRTTTEILHELGHLAGLRHCDNYDCLMRFAATVEAVDLRGMAFCASCSAALPPHLRPSVRP